MPYPRGSHRLSGGRDYRRVVGAQARGAGTLAPTNSVAPAVTGTATVGQTLSTTNGTWANVPTSYTYQWQRDGVNIGSATASTYLLVAADAWKAVRCVVTAINAGGSTAANSNATAKVLQGATATFETGVNGNNVGTGDAGAATAWDAVTPNTGTITYSNSSPAVGSLSGKFSTTASTQTFTTWSTALGTVADHYGRFYLKSSVVNSTRVYMSLYSGASLCCYLFSDGTGHLGIDGHSGGSQVMTTAISANTWYRVEYRVIHSTTVGQFEIKLFSSIESSTPTETLTSTANKNFRASADTIKYGIGCSVGAYASTDVYLDNIAAGATSYPGPS